MGPHVSTWHRNVIETIFLLSYMPTSDTAALRLHKDTGPMSKGKQTAETQQCSRRPYPQLADACSNVLPQQSIHAAC